MSAMMNRCPGKILTCFVLVCLLAGTESIKTDKRRKDKTPSTGPPQQQNICDITDRQQLIHCYCETSNALKNATKAECWIFNGNMQSDEPIWDAFQSQNRIQEINFNVRINGGLSFVPTRALKYLKRLKTLTISYGGIDTVTSFAFANLSMLKDLTITRNKIVYLEPYAFAKLSNLSTLTMDENRISEIGNNSFVDLPVLEKLYMTNNNVSIIQNGAFRQLVQLIELDMDRNSIATLNKETFDGLANLKKLEMRYNRIRVLNDFTFAELWNLQELHLDENQLTVIAERAFDGLAQLRLLSLNANRLTVLTGGLLEGVRGLSSLYIKNNFLQTITADDIKPILDNLKNTSSHLLLDGNNFSCDCRLTWMHSLRNDTKNEETRVSLESITCSMDIRPRNHKAKADGFENMDNQLYDKSKHSDLGNDLDYDGDEAQRDSVSSDPEMGNNTKKGNRKRLFQIPVDSLPCPEELKDSTEAPLLRPSRGEVKDYRGQNTVSISTSNSRKVTSCYMNWAPLAFLILLRY